MHANTSHILEAVTTADRLGFDGALMPDHYMWGPRGGMHLRQNPYETLETWTTFSYLAAKTEQIHLVTLVTPIPFRPPGMLAKMLSTLDVLSNGRVVLGIGAGWSKVEFDGYSKWDGAKTRVDKTQEGLELIIKLWTEDKVNFKGRFYEAKDAVLEPKPVQKPYPKLLFGGTGKRMLRMAGRYGDIIYVPMWIGDVDEGWQTVKDAAGRHGRASKIEFMAGDMGVRAPLDVKSQKEKIEKVADRGAGYYMTAFPRGPGYFDAMKEFASEVIPSYR